MNHKRKKPKARTRSKPLAWSRRYSGPANWMRCWPKSHDVIYFRRPARMRAEREVARLLRGEVESDELMFEPPKRPHPYFW